MKHRISFIFRSCLILGSIFLLTQCIPTREINYLQVVDPSAFKPLDGITDKYFLQTNDYLSIIVTSMDPKLSSFFNQNSQSGSGSTSSSSSNAASSYYMIDDSMNIDFPYVGLINLKGCNLKLAKKKIVEALNPFLKESIVNVQLVLSQFTILGEVGRQGAVPLIKNQITIFDAVGGAGITQYGKRKDIKLVRHYPTETKTFSIDLTDAKIVDSEFYYIYPNDVIYIRAMNAKKFGLTEQLSFSMITTLIRLYLTIYAITK